MRKLNKNIKNFAYLSLGNLVNKFIGLAREIIISSSFGASLELSMFIILKTGVDFFALFSGSSALQANIVPRYARIFNRLPFISYKNTQNSAIFLSTILTLASFFVLIIVGYFYNYLKYFFFWTLNITLSLSLGIMIYNQIGLLLNQAKGNFLYYSIWEVNTSALTLFFLYPSIILLKISGIVMSKLLAFIFLAKKCWKNIDVNRKEEKDQGFSFKDIDIGVVLINNINVLLILLTRWLFNDSTQVVYFYYACLVLNAFITIFSRSLSSIILKKSSLAKDGQDTENSTTIIVVSILGVAPFFISVFIFSHPLSTLLFTFGNFGINDSLKVAEYIQFCCLPFFIHYIFILFLQPIFSRNESLFLKQFTFFILGGIGLITTIILLLKKYFSYNTAFLFLYMNSLYVFIVVIIGYYLLFYYSPRHNNYLNGR